MKPKISSYIHIVINAFLKNINNYLKKDLYPHECLIFLIRLIEEIVQKRVWNCLKRYLHDYHYSKILSYLQTKFVLKEIYFKTFRVKHYKNKGFKDN